MFQWISIVGFAVIIAGILLHSLLFPCGYSRRFSLGTLIRKKVHLLTLLFPEQNLNWPAKARKFIFLLGLFSFCVLLVTGFGPLLFGSRLQGILLMVHATFAPVFIGSAAVVVLLGADEYAFRKKDTRSIPLGAKAGFWLLAVLSLPVTLTMALSMFPLFGSEGQEVLFHAHRWYGLVFAWIAMVELYMLIRMEVLKDMER
ncbi:MAG: hypothetical protein ABFR90_06440 [Planctomycetota bacterium]